MELVTVTDGWADECLLDDMFKYNNTMAEALTPKHSYSARREDWLNSSDEEGSDWMLKITGEDKCEETRCLLSETESEEEQNEVRNNPSAGPCFFEMRKSWITFDDEILDTKTSLEHLLGSPSFTLPSPTPGICGSDIEYSLSGTDLSDSKDASPRSGICQVSDSESINYLFKDTDSVEDGRPTVLLTNYSHNDNLMTQNNDLKTSSESRAVDTNLMGRAIAATARDEQIIPKKKNKKLSKVLKLFGRLNIKGSKKRGVAKVKSADSTKKRSKCDTTDEDDLSSECLLVSDDKTTEKEKTVHVKKSPSEKLIRRFFFRIKKSKKRDSIKRTRLNRTASFQQDS